MITKRIIIWLTGIFQLIFMHAAAQTFTALHNFGITTNADGVNPRALIASGNTLYGVAVYGGSGQAGTVFALNNNGTNFNVLHNFSALSNPFWPGENWDGAYPFDHLILAGNTLYGTANGGGSTGSGTVFAMNTNGDNYTVLYTFSTVQSTSGPGDFTGTNGDGAFPAGGLVLAGNTLYGTTWSGGIWHSGTVFAVNTDGSNFTVLYSFGALLATNVSGDYTNNDGARPLAGLTLVGNTLYGTTFLGGSGGNGTVFAVNTNGSNFTVLHYFSTTGYDANGDPTNADGASPQGNLILTGNTILGTAGAGGSGGNGTVFALDTNGNNFAVLYTFSVLLTTNDAGIYFNGDGSGPEDLALMGSTIYGAAYSGGSAGNGTIFSLNTNGSNFMVLYSFSASLATNSSGIYTNGDGANPHGLTLAGNTLCGTAYNGGGSGDGTVFALPLSNGGQTLVVNGQALIPAGSFTMGDANDTNAEGTAALQNIYVSAFYMDTNLVSLTQWQAVYGWATNHGYGFKNVGSGKGAEHPVQTVDWYDCVKWCNARSQQAGLAPVYFTDAGLTRVYTNGEPGPIYVNWNGLGYRLPTEAEWEKAARGGLSGLRFPLGNTISETEADYDSTNLYFYDLGPSGYNANFDMLPTPYTSPVGTFAANGYGLYDMAGNVWQWCWDWYDAPYGQPTTNNPTGPASPAPQPYGPNRVIRGGGWDEFAYACRTAWRNNGVPADPENDTGFRTVLAALSPTITNGPQSQTVSAGANVEFTAGAGGVGPLGWQWYFGSAPILGATNDDYEITDVQTTNAGAYTVVASNPFGTASAVANLAVAVVSNCISPPPGLIAWWRGNGNANDIVGGYNGVLDGGVSFTNGPSGQAFNFDGTGTVVVPDAPALDFATNAPISVEVWVYCTAEGDLLDLIGKGLDCSGNTSPNYELAFDHNSGDGLIFDGDSGDASGVDLPLNSWRHVVGTFDGVTNTVYLDGDLIGSADGTALGPESDSPLLIGGAGSCYMFQGMMQNIRIYNRALSADEVSSLFNATASGICTGPLPPCIVLPPADTTALFGASVTLGVTVSGTAPLSCRWYHGGSPLPGATNTDYIITNAQAGNAGNYTVVVTNAYGATNAIAMLTLSTGAYSAGPFLFITNNNTITITGYTGTNPVVNIPNEINGCPVTAIGTNAFYTSTVVTSVTIPNGVTSIEDGAFYGCTSLTGVYFSGNAPSTVGAGVFAISGPLCCGPTGPETVYYLPGTTGWSQFLSNADVPGALWTLPYPLILAGSPGFGIQSNRFSFTISWASNQSVVVQTCTNLAAPGWQSLQTNMLVSGTNWFSDSKWSDFPARYYRVSVP